MKLRLQTPRCQKALFHQLFKLPEPENIPFRLHILLISFLIEIMEAFMENPGLCHIGEKIFRNLDFQTQLTCRLVNKTWYHILENEASKSYICMNLLVQPMFKSMTPNCTNQNQSIEQVFEMYSKATNWLNLVQAVFDKEDNLFWINIYLQKHINHQNETGFQTYTLEYFVSKRNLKMVDLILKENLHKTIKTFNLEPTFDVMDFNRALKQAIENRDTEIVECLKPYMSTEHFRKFVFEDSIIGNLYALKILIPNPNEPLIVDARNNNPIHVAADKGHVEIVKYFIENTEGLKAGNKFGCTPLQMAIFYDNQEVVKIINEALAF